MIETARLRLRPWRADDAAEFARVTNTPAVMAHLDGVQPMAAMEEACARQQATQREHGFSFWIVERRGDGAMLGFCGLKPVTVEGVSIAGEVEIGWRLGEAAWGKGYGREAATACLDWAWASTALPRIVSMTVPANRRSWGLMERIGMERRPDLDFAHPMFEAGHPLSRHVVYVAERP